MCFVDQPTPFFFFSRFVHPVGAISFFFSLSLPGPLTLDPILPWAPLILVQDPSQIQSALSSPVVRPVGMAGRGGPARTNGAAPVGNKICQFKLVLLGESAVGKSSLVLRFVKGQFHEYQESTIGG